MRPDLNNPYILKASTSLRTLGVAAFALVLCTYCTPKKEAEVEEETFERVVVDENPPSTPLSPEESMRKIVLPPGFDIQLVASEPMVQEPVAMAWDGNGRLYVAEMNTYMKDNEGTDQFQPTSTPSLYL